MGLTGKHLLDLDPNSLSTDPFPKCLAQSLILQGRLDVLVQLKVVPTGEPDATDDAKGVVVEG